MTITRYTTENGHGRYSDLDTDDYQEAVAYAQHARHRVIALEYEFVDSHLVAEADFLEWHWHTHTTDARTAETISGCQEDPGNARDDLADALENLADELPACTTNPSSPCGDCVACRRRTETTAAAARLSALPDLEETTTVSLAIGLPGPVTYTITRVLAEDCDHTPAEATR